MLKKNTIDNSCDRKRVSLFVYLQIASQNDCLRTCAQGGLSFLMEINRSIREIQSKKTNVKDPPTAR
jgi:hypothetical protein